ncbi:MAG: chromosomal replication initiator protein DnaA [Dehalococcoidia bacterium]
MKFGSAKDIWETTLGELQTQVNRANYDTWLKASTGQSYSAGLFVVGVASPFAREWLEKRLRSLVRKTLMGITGQDLDVEFVLRSAGDLETHEVPAGETKTRSTPASSPPQPARSSRLNPRYTFDNFVVGDCNRMAYAAALEAAENPGGVNNPLFIYGGVGLGKTHLLHAIGHLGLARNLQLLYVSGEQFTNEFVAALHDKKTSDFRSKYRNLDLFLVDDVNFILGKEQTQESFFHTFNDLHNACCQIVVSSNQPPQAMAQLREKMRSRFQWGLTAHVEPPTLDTRLAILEGMAERRGADISPDVLELLAKRIERNIRELEGSLNQLMALARVNRAPITREFALEALDDSDMPRPAPLSITPPRILEAVTAYFNLTPQALAGRQRNREITMARHIAMYLLQEEGNCSLSEVRSLLGGRDRSTITYAHRKVASGISSDPALHEHVSALRHQLANPSEPHARRLGRQPL